MNNMQNSLMNNLNKACDLLDQLDHILDEEQSVLRKREFNELVDIADRKNHYLSQLDDNYHDRESLLTQLKLSHNADGLRTFIEDYAEEPETLRDLWSNTQDKLQRCRERNTVNGTVIAINLHNNRYLQQLLKGQDGTDNTYDPTGQLNTNSSTLGGPTKA